MTTSRRITRRDAVRRMAAAGFAAPFAFRLHAAAPNETVLHASVGAGGMAGEDITSLSRTKHFKLVAVADVDQGRAAALKQKHPDVHVYQDWREMLDKEKGLTSLNVSTPDHMHAPATMRAMQQGLHVYTQKPLTQTIYEARQLTRVAAEKKLVTQMGIQIHSHQFHRTVVRLIHAGAVGKVKEVHSWSGKGWGDTAPRPDRADPVPAGLNWDLWLGVAAERPYIGNGYYHPSNWRKRLDFGTGTFGDMGCHILDPVFGALELTAPISVRSEGDPPSGDNWGYNAQVTYLFPETRHTRGPVPVTWYNGDRRPPAEIVALTGRRLVPEQAAGKSGRKDGKGRGRAQDALQDQGSIYVGTEGVLYSPYIAAPILLPADKFKGFEVPKPGAEDHYVQFVEACRGNGQTSTPFSYSGPLTEMVLLGCLATRFPQTLLQWDAANLRVTNDERANRYVRKTYRKGWEVPGL